MVVNKVGILIASVMMLASCGKEQREELRDEASILYSESVKLLKLYSDSMLTVHDEDEAHAFAASLYQQLDSLNFSVPADTDLKLTEGENDTLYAEAMKFRKIYDQTVLNLKTDTITVESDE